MNTQIQKNDNQYLLLWQLNASDISHDWFNANYWREQGKIYAEKKGRASVWFFNHNNIKGVLRHYWRGGLIGKLLKDEYCYLGLEKTRVFKEFELLIQLRKKGLNVPEPISAQVTKSGLIYRGDIITSAIDGAQSLLDILKQRTLTEHEIKQVASTISQFHQQGVYHADLNINNVLFDEVGKVFLIDFDRGELKNPNSQWQQSNMSRLHRSFEKEKNRNIDFNWQDEDWNTFHTTYKKCMT